MLNATMPTSSLGRHGCSWSSDLQGHKRPRRWLWSSGKALTVAGMSLLTNRCWPCRPVFWKIQTGGDVRILSVDEEGGRADNLRKISVHHTSTELQETFKPSNAKRVCSHFYWPIIFCTTNSSRVPARERWQTFENSWGKHNIYRTPRI